MGMEVEKELFQGCQCLNLWLCSKCKHAAFYAHSSKTNLENFIILSMGSKEKSEQEESHRNLQFQQREDQYIPFLKRGKNIKQVLEIHPASMIGRQKYLLFEATNTPLLQRRKATPCRLDGSYVIGSCFRGMCSPFPAARSVKAEPTVRISAVKQTSVSCFVLTTMHWCHGNFRICPISSAQSWVPSKGTLTILSRAKGSPCPEGGWVLTSLLGWQPPAEPSPRLRPWNRDMAVR